MAKARRSSAEQSTHSDAHGPSEGQPIAKGTTARSTKARASQPAKGKDTHAATRKPRGAAASAGPESVRGEPGSPVNGRAAGSAKRAAAAHSVSASPAQASSQAISLLPGASTARTGGDLTPQAPRPAWSLLPTPRERFHAWIAHHGSEDAALIELCSDLVEHTRSLLAFCKAHGFAHSTVFEWINDERAPHRADKYARAREARADVFAEQTIEIADEEEVNRVIDPETGAVEEVTFDATAVARNRLRVDARKWLASKMNPRRYGEKQTVSVGGDPDAPPVNLSHTVTFVAAQAAAPAQIVEEVTPLPRIEGGS